MLKILGIKEAAERLGISVRVLEAHLQRIGPVDDHGRPYYRMTPGRGKRLFSEEQIEMLWETLPSGQDVLKINITMPRVMSRKRSAKKLGKESERSKAREILEQRLQELRANRG